MKNTIITCALSIFALHAGAATLSYETAVPTANIVTGSDRTPETDKFVSLGAARNGGQTFTAPAAYSAVTEVWFEVGQDLGSAVTGSETVELMFWNNTGPDSWIGLPDSSSTPTLSATAYSTSLGTIDYPAAADITAGTWLKFTLDAADQAAIGALAASGEYGFTLYASDLSLNLARHTDTSGYNIGAVVSSNGSIDPKVAGSRDSNFFIVGTLQGTDPNSPQSTHDVYNLNEDGTLAVSAPGVLVNDADPNELPLTAVLDTAPTDGTLNLNTNGSFTYIPNEDFYGNDSFTYKAFNGSLYSTDATVSITVTNLTDAPIATADSYLVTSNRTLNIPVPGVLRNDTDADDDALRAIKVSDPANGSLSFNPDGSFSYTPTNGYAGADSFTYYATDGVLTSETVTVSLNVANQPNFIIIYADDMGFGDAGFNGFSDIFTPSMDSFASNGVRFTQGYACDSVCGPSRAGLMTGVYPARMGVISNPAAGNGLTITQPMISEMLKPKGYNTAVYGKWHLGVEEGLVQPLDRGFDEFFGFLGGAHKFAENTDSDNLFMEGNEPATMPAEYYLTDLISDRSVEFIEQNTNHPFFLYMAYNAVHSPWDEVPSNYIDRVEAATTTIPTNWPHRTLFAANLLAMDDGVGQIMDALEANGLSENTLVFFISDNGTPEGQNDPINGTPVAPDHKSSTGGFRGWKGDTYEGGIRVPFSMNWKGQIPAGLVYDKPVINLDAAATIFELAQAGSPREHPYEIPAGMESRFPYPTFELDGVDLMPYLTEKNPNHPHEKLYFRHGEKHAVIYGDLKLTWNDRTLEDRGDAIIEVDRVFDLSIDPMETNDLAPGNPELTEMLKGEFALWDCAMDPVVWGSEPDNRVCLLPSAGYYSWIGEQTNDTRTSVSGAYADLDGDGTINYFEYAFNEPPLSLTPGQPFEIQTPVRHGDASISYILQISSDLQTWETVALTYSAGSWISSDPAKIQQASYLDNGNGTGALVLQTGSAYASELKLFVRIGIEM